MISEIHIKNTILLLRGHKVIIDADLAEIYGVTTKQLNRAIKRNMDRFPKDFMFQLNRKEKQQVVTNCDHLHKLKFSHYLPFAFTEHGAVMAANILNSYVAVQASIQVVRVFVKIREIITSHKDIARKIEKLERKMKGGFAKHDKEIQILFEAIRQLMQTPASPRKRIGYKTYTE